MKTQHPMLPLLLALGMVIGSLALSYVVKSAALSNALFVLHLPAGLLAFLVLPGATFSKSGSPAVILTVTGVFAIVQWYVIFAAGIWLCRRFAKTEEVR